MHTPPSRARATTTAGPRRHLLRGAAGAAAAAVLAAAPAVARAQGGAAAFPTRPVSLIVPFPPGGTTDIVMRALGEAAGRQLSQTIVIENRPGAASTLGPAAVARARPDGYLLTQLPASAVRAQILMRLPFDPLRDFQPILHLTGYAFGTIVRADSPYKEWKDFVAEAKRRPGELSFGSTGANGTPHVAMLELAEREGIELVHAPVRGDADGSQALLGGHIDLMAGGSGLGGLVEGGQARWLNVWTAQRLRKFPDTPTLVELGYDGMVVTSPFGIVGPARMDERIVRVLHDAFAAATRDPAYATALERYDMEPDYKNTADYAAFLRALHAREAETIRRLGLSAG
jgi:tripartite-type tricarboxylate transporter receptor subunit TctC